ncbi:penicillin-binding protein 1A [Atopomonas sediminilitoris]|uniref:penicillin-binding protein 1A n=1 Tax=Atopomonas sediminilitoris TaxID=2919919 RepID=UPI001F4D64B9|nr:penicillin-binding protein 1A [Atopomonas sediminilitoris]MCJ8170397.1 penicillin-binding protein 1A [Atopomonas sediminilitoris]
MRLIKFLWWSLLALLCAPIMALSGAYLYLNPTLPDVDTLKSVQLQIPLRVYSQDERLIAEFGEMRRNPITYQQIPQDFINALLAAEDDNFQHHYGVDVKSLMRAAAQLLQSGRIQSGGSTITMQVAKNFFLSSERSFSRKLNEILLALQIERQLTKAEILELYVNKIYLGNRSYGIEAAANVYYGKSIQELSLAQLAMIAGLPKAPSRFNPLVNPARAKERRDWILGRMHKLGSIDTASLEAALAAPVDAEYHVPKPEVNAPYIAEMARAEMVGLYGSAAYTDGFNVYVTINSSRQQLANHALRSGLIEYDRRHGYRGPEARLGDKTETERHQRLAQLNSMNGMEPALVTSVEASGIMARLRNGNEHVISWDSMKWARPFINSRSMGARPQKPADVVSVGDIIRIEKTLKDEQEIWEFAQVPKAQSALVSLNPHTGAIEALVGGFSFEQSNYNRAAQAKRQPGSSFKPFIYAAAIDKGYSPASLVNDAPIVFVDEHIDKVWRPKNDNNTFLGPITLREALYRSRNLVSIRLLQDIGIDYALKYAQLFGFDPDDLPRNYSLALGTASLTPMQIATGWSVFANGGFQIKPYLLERITDRDGKELLRVETPTKQAVALDEEETGEAMNLGQLAAEVAANEAAVENLHMQRVIDERTAYLMTSMLQDVIRRGTGRRALALGRSDLAGKTGTTNESKDAWFSGYNADLVTTVWVGFDQPESLGRNEYGGTAALPIWMSYMGGALQDMPAHLPAEPSGMVSLRVDPNTGRAAAPGTPDAYFEVFKAEQTPPAAETNPYYPQDSVSGQPATSAPIDLF